MSPERLRQVEELYHAAREGSPDERAALLATTDAELRREVELLLPESGRCEFLDRPAIQNEPELLADSAVSVTAIGHSLQPHHLFEHETYTPLAPGSSVGPYRLIRELGRGGMSIVWLADRPDGLLNRQVAMKFPLALLHNSTLAERFARERNILAQLAHPHIARLYDAGITPSGQPYLALEYVGGLPITQSCESRGLAERQRLELSLEVLQAVEYAHANSIVHRDLKPSNILVTKEGQVRLLDFGIAKLLVEGEAGETELTRAGGRALTPEYASPEQLTSEPVTKASDIYSVGLVLGDLLGGSKSKNTIALPKKFPADLRTIILHALREEPAERYSTAAEFAEDVERYLLCKPILARPDSRWYVARKFTLRNKASLAPVVLALGLGLGIASWLAKRAEEPVQLRMIPFTTFAGGQYEPSFSPDGTRVAFVWDGETPEVFNVYTKPVAGGDPQRVSKGPVSEGSPCWSPDGTRIAFVRYAAGPDEAGVFLVSASGGSPRRLSKVLPVPHIYDRHLDWSADGRYLALADQENVETPSSIFLIDVSTGERRKITDPPNTGRGDTGPEFSPDSKTIAFTRTVSSGVADVFTIPITGGKPSQLTSPGQDILSHAWTADGREIVVSFKRRGDTGVFRIAVHGGKLRLIPSFRIPASFLAISRSGQLLAFSHWFVDTNIWQFQIATKKSLKLIASTRDDRSPQYSPDGGRIVFRSDRSGSNEIWVSHSDGSHQEQVTNFGGPLTGSPQWSPDGRWIAFDSRPLGNSDIFVAPPGQMKPRQITFDGADDVTPSWSGDGRWIYFASNRTGAYQVWKIAADAEETRTKAIQVTHQGGFRPEVASDGTLFYAKGIGVPGIWSVTREGNEIPILPDYPAGYWGYWCVAPGGLYFATRSPSPLTSFCANSRNHDGTIARGSQLQNLIRQKNSWVDSGSGNLPGE